MAHLVYDETPSFGAANHGQAQQLIPFQTTSNSLRILLLHGNLEIWIYHARNLPNMDVFHKTPGEMVSMLSRKLGGKSESRKSKSGTSDPYVTVSVAGAVIARTFVINDDENPVWTQHFNVPVAHHASEVHFVVKDCDILGSEVIGAVGIPVEQLCGGAKVEGFFPILNSSGKPCKDGSVLSLSIQYTPVQNVPLYIDGVGAGPDYEGVPGTYFPLRKGGNVTLYQDAHVHEGCLPSLEMDGDVNYEHRSCWHDIYDAISQARRLVYIVGWSVYYNVSLIRDRDDGKGYTLGELLKAKSQEGVRVLLLVWDDPTSRSMLGYKTVGLMNTHDEDTRRFFKHSSVRVLLCPRSGGKGHSWVKKQEAGTIYTHHQKTVIVDADAGENKRKIIAFIGGLDLCVGRYDTPNHPIFRTLQTTHKHDFHNPNYEGSVTGCPRQPWHDLHSQVDGPAAYDILTNFEERWLRALKIHKLQKMKGSHDDSLLKIDRIPDIVGIDEVPCLDEDNQETWHVQVFRSIDSNSVKGFPKEPTDAIRMNLVCGKNVMIDMSIHSAYVKAIRAAQKFIYIENQYFIGSSYNWDTYKDLGANNLIPMEIALKIAEKIKQNERFSVYIVIPMWPEGVPTSTATQRILFWQYKTMEMMYETIYKALQEAGLDNEYEPQDYLNFFCLGNREIPDDGNASNVANPTGDRPQKLTKKNRRFMIYVHSKGMIVDDEYVLLGSANINQRSLEGTRDTEIAMGAYQPNHTWAMKQSKPSGQVYGYRMSLWSEHIGGVEECFEEPESLECVRRIRSLSESNWRQYMAEEVTEMESHLLKYPLEVDSKGKVNPILGCETFPDVGGNISGTFTLLKENLTI
ncbi:phospholipase D beta 1 [Cajanus cajan]|uniref:Phospholipase D n=1 Tax=Cajanus cajan TaxID=3821 RepID=A0A151TJM4_CAJCA|nr:phospholipase D beta 1 [Cajanus cajan]KYP67240.1 Phospholipase D beta 1 [Cajanus cajan]